MHTIDDDEGKKDLINLMTYILGFIWEPEIKWNLEKLLSNLTDQ